MNPFTVPAIIDIVTASRGRFAAFRSNISLLGLGEMPLSKVAEVVASIVPISHLTAKELAKPDILTIYNFPADSDGIVIVLFAAECVCIRYVLDEFPISVSRDMIDPTTDRDIVNKQEELLHVIADHVLWLESRAPRVSNLGEMIDYCNSHVPAAERVSHPSFDPKAIIVKLKVHGKLLSIASLHGSTVSRPFNETCFIATLDKPTAEPTAAPADKPVSVPVTVTLDKPVSATLVKSVAVTLAKPAGALEPISGNDVLSAFVGGASRDRVAMVLLRALTFDDILRCAPIATPDQVARFFSTFAAPIRKAIVGAGMSISTKSGAQLFEDRGIIGVYERWVAAGSNQKFIQKLLANMLGVHQLPITEFVRTMEPWEVIVLIKHAASIYADLIEWTEPIARFKASCSTYKDNDIRHMQAHF